MKLAAKMHIRKFTHTALIGMPMRSVYEKKKRKKKIIARSVVDSWLVFFVFKINVQLSVHTSTHNCSFEIAPVQWRAVLIVSVLIIIGAVVIRR